MTCSFGFHLLSLRTRTISRRRECYVQVAKGWWMCQKGGQCSNLFSLCLLVLLFDVYHVA
jgi:hypothetical protein